MPASLPNAICGPQVNDTKSPTGKKDLADLNPCPLNACCNIWGQCGITSGFCTDTREKGSAPGTAKSGTNGCISNCGTRITGNDGKPSTFRRIAYFEAYNRERECLHMAPRDIDVEYYNHVHYAFGDITEGFDLDISRFPNMFEEFVELRGAKRILALGGWAFSTEKETYTILREGVNDENRSKFAANVVKFVKEHELDGIDFDWEYPSAPNIPGIPPGRKEEGDNYLKFLRLVRDELPEDKTVSIAAPASYWYLKGFPIKEIGKAVDYLVFMTYDLHGQWGYGSKFASPGCSNGNCLRSHVNLTETELALAMITKAGVPAEKIVAGMALYGRSFEMTKAGCHEETCTYTGPESGARPGECTNTAGYLSNYEIARIITDGSIDSRVIEGEEGDILIYDETQWVSFLTTSQYRERSDWIQDLNFGGISDWATDLNDTYPVGNGDGDGDGNAGGGGDSSDGSGEVLVSPDVWKDIDQPVRCQPPCTFVFPPWSLSEPTVISQPPVTLTYLAALSGEASDSDSSASTVMVTVTTILSIPPVTTDVIEVSNVIWSTGEGDVSLTPSVKFPGLKLTGKPLTTDEPTSTVYPGYTFTYNPGPWPPMTSSTSSSKSEDDDESTSTSNGDDESTSTEDVDDSGPTIIPPPPFPPGFPSSISFSKGPMAPSCTAGCGTPCVANCDPEPPCFGVCGCVGPLCPGGEGDCVGPGCGGGGGGGGGNGETNPGSCEEPETASVCTVVIMSTIVAPAKTFSTWSITNCLPTVGCTATDSTTHTTRTTDVYASMQTPFVIWDDHDFANPLEDDFGFDTTRWVNIHDPIYWSTQTFGH